MVIGALRRGPKDLLWFGLFGFYDISTFIGNLMPDPFYTNKQFYLKQFSLIVKNISISSYSV